MTTKKTYSKKECPQMEFLILKDYEVGKKILK